jgi:formamidopyrimidine-DNA glycosylase
MPELPEVETVCKALKSKILNQTIKSFTIHNAKLRWPVPQELSAILPGQAFHDITRRGKYLLLHTKKGTALVHLGLTGNLRILPAKHTLILHEHVTIVFSSGDALSFIDPRKFGAFLWTEKDPFEHALLKTMGPEPLTSAFSGATLANKARHHQIPIKQLLMDSHIVAGIGNIYANEALFMAKIHPQRSAHSLSDKEYLLLVECVKKVLRKALAHGGTTIRDFAASDGRGGYFQQELQVYGRSGQACLLCKTKIEETRTAQRSTFYCPRCQR